jgi:hypothetical protein
MWLGIGFGGECEEVDNQNDEAEDPPEVRMYEEEMGPKVPPHVSE